MTSIYVLRDPRNGNVRYVGKSVAPGTRFVSHLNDPTGCLKALWIEELAEEGVQPVMQVVEVVPDGGNWKRAERRWIKRLLDRGVDLTNSTTGGDGEPYAWRHWVDADGAVHLYPRRVAA